MLDKIIRFSIKNKIVIGIMTLLLIIWGVWSATKLPIDATPDITNNQVQIITVCPTLAGQEVEQLVTFPIEQSIANVPDIEETRSISRFGLSVITVVFKEEVDVYFARQLISEKLKQAAEEIPKGIGTPELAPVSTGLGEVYQYILHPKKGSEKKYDSKELRTMQDWIVRRQLNGTPGVAEINSFGGQLKQYEVAVNPDRLRAMGVSISDIFAALEKNNQNTGGAYIDKKPNAYFIRGIGLVTSLEDVGNVVVKNETGSVPIFIKDVAEVRLGSAVRYGAMTFNGEVDAVGGVVMMLKGANSNEVVQLIKEKIPTIQKSLPTDVIIEPYLDRTNLVGRAIDTVEKNLIEGALIVIFVLVVFLGNLRAGLIVASAIPLSLLFALGMMNVFGVSANLMSLGAIDFGLIVDGAVIIVEATLHHLGLRKTTRLLTQSEMDEEVFLSASKIRSSAAFGEIIILIVYIPILTLVGVEGKMFTPMAKTVGFAIFGALILSLTYIPMMSALFLSKKISHKENFSDKMMNRLQKIYQPLLEKALKVKYWLVSVTVALFAVSLFIFGRMGGEFIPQLQEGDFAFHCILPQGSSLSQSIETSMQASRLIKQFDEVKMVVGKTGAAEVPTDPMPPEATDMMVILKPQSEWKTKKSYDELADEISEKLEAIPGVFFEKNQPIQMRFNELMTGIRQDVAVKIFGENLDSLAIYADKTAKIIQSVNGASAPQIERVSGLPQINVEYDRTRMANYGLNIEDVNTAVSTAFAGQAAGQVFENERRFDLVVRLDSLHRTSIDDVNNLMVSTKTGIQIPLSQVSNINYKLGPAQISREAGKRRIVIGFNVKGRDVESVVEEIQQKLNKEKLPSGYYYTYGGQFENLKAASKRLTIAVPVSLFLIFMLLYFTFGSLKQATLIFTAIPMSAIGGVFALMLRGMPFSISAGIGFIALFGVAVLNGIVLIGTFNQLEKEGETNILKRVMEGTKTRLRPVLMTATVASLGFLPMAISTGAGAEVQKPLATVVIGGLVTATFLTLFVLPMLYIIFSTKLKIKNISGNKPLTAVLVLGFLFFGQTFNAQQGNPLTVAEATNIALSNNNLMRSRDLDIKVTEALKPTAKELPKMSVDAQLGQYNSKKFDQSFSISQSIPFPTLFKARRELIAEQIKGKQINKEISANELARQVRTYYYQIEYLQFNQSKLKNLDSLYQDFIRIATVRFKSGDIKKIEINTAETQKGEISLLLKQNEVYLNNAYKNLKTLLNTSGDISVPYNTNYEPLKANYVLDSTSIANHPTVRSYYQEMAIAEKNKNVERSLGLPDFSIGYTNQSLIGTQTINGMDQNFNAGNRFHAATIGVTIPLTFGATKARIQSWEFQKQVAESNAKLQQKQLEAQLQNALNQYQQDVEQYNYYVNQAIPNAEKIAKAGQLGYKTGEISYVELLFALQTSTNIQLKYLESIQQVNQSVITINSIINK
ncbi:CusA/CzcA family heavy metal efflux RND transporter [Chryseobacterium carnipullorum]|uniref:Cation efflux system protein CzcA n=1 Tax=Chryseobacterium carnipullorum TaxID=1124835 RepID=A0A376E8H9_CHRCU|nr:CusA/CzcA family heavy metal efflux RND transporter [Chryseobacterium carnipullorum]AZA51484.1 CusA/CzcA family heavy metal efflux RND transporter [Chryseobacterium carnipullorum]AZA67799.1 CusA/CzcA family heavy metal efflux RND transporter [Chryseobacterium carnipullorum]STD04711.1 Cation efflux system protein CzcA [Chryseobacterium carnipullorum]